MTFAEMRVKWSVILKDRFGSEILTVLDTKGQVLHRLRVHLKVPGWLPDLNALLNFKKLKNFKILHSDPETKHKFPIPPLISFKRDKNIGNFLVRSAHDAKLVLLYLTWLRSQDRIDPS